MAVAVAAALAGAPDRGSAGTCPDLTVLETDRGIYLGEPLPAAAGIEQGDALGGGVIDAPEGNDRCERRRTDVDVNALAPGALNTRLLDEVLAAGPERVGRDVYERAQKQQADGGAPLEKAAELALFLASSASDGISGRLLSSVWDDWPSLPGKRDALRASDVYTLRRIVPRDRGWPE